MEKITKQLKELKRISPDKDFTKESRLLVLSSPLRPFSWMPEQIAEIVKYITAVSMTTGLIILIIGGFSFLQRSPVPLMITGLDIKALKAEAESLGIDVSISKLEYYNESSEKVNIALDQTIKDDPVYFQKIILEKETDSVKLEDPTNKNIDRALNEIFK